MEVFGFIGTILINVAYFPQLVKLFKEKSVKDLSKYMYILLIIAGASWIIYGVSINSLSIIICNSINLIQSIIILYLIIKYNKRKDYGEYHELHSKKSVINN